MFALYSVIDQVEHAGFLGNYVMLYNNQNFNSIDMKLSVLDNKSFINQVKELLYIIAVDQWLYGVKCSLNTARFFKL